MNQSDRFRGCLLGLAVGDVVGSTVEFQARGSFEPVTDMVGGGPIHLEPGEWTDDTYMVLCLTTILLETGQYDPDEQMRRYCRWRDDGYLSSNGRYFDFGGTVSEALRSYDRTDDPYSGSTSPRAAGNGCIMRLAPVPIFLWRDRAAAVGCSGESSRTTHGAPECVDTCRPLGSLIVKALTGVSKDRMLFDNTELSGLSPPIEETPKRGLPTAA